MTCNLRIFLLKTRLNTSNFFFRGGRAFLCINVNKTHEKVKGNVKRVEKSEQFISFTWNIRRTKVKLALEKPTEKHS